MGKDKKEKKARKEKKKKRAKIHGEIRVQFRTTQKEKHKLHWLAKTYAKGNVSAWIRHAIKEAPRTHLRVN